MKVLEHPSLKSLNTFGVDATAGLLLTIETEEDLLSLPAFDPHRDFVLGGGSNVLFVSNVPGAVFLNRISGREIISEHDGYALLEVGAGENWHQLVRWALDQGLSGLENLSLIPGLAGAAPIQNIGAYGVELSSVLEWVTAWDWHNSNWVTFSKDECRFGYRDSFFKSVETDRYFISSIRLLLNRQFRPQLDYAGLRDALSSLGIDHPEAKQVSDTVIRIRQQKLPDPAVTGNAGSFFKNPVVSMDEAELLHSRFTGLPTWPAGADRARLSAAWLIDHCGWKGFQENGAAVSSQHALVLVNQGQASGRQILELSGKIISSVEENFGVILEPEPKIYKGPDPL
jgi:UDP-N-acetylmuramate dehydrogenase